MEKETTMVEELVLQFDNVMPVKIENIPLILPDGTVTNYQHFTADYDKRDEILKKHNSTGTGRMIE